MTIKRLRFMSQFVINHKCHKVMEYLMDRTHGNCRNGDNCIQQCFRNVLNAGSFSDISHGCEDGAENT